MLSRSPTLIALALLAGVAGSLAGVPVKREATEDLPVEAREEEVIETAVEGEGEQPKITYSKPTVGKLGEDAQFDCSVVGIDLQGVSDFAVLWSKIDEKNPIHSFPISNNERVMLFSDRFSVMHEEDTYQYSLKLTNATDEDAGTYRCTVSFGNDQRINADVPFNVEKSPFFTDDLLKEIAVSEGDGISIDCQPGGWPRPEVYWERLNNDLPYYGGKFFKSNKLDIPLVERDHSGHYVCYADNGLGTAQSHILITVQYAPQVTVRKDQVFAVPGEEVRMECASIGRPAVDVAWYKDGEVMMGEGNVRLTQTEDESKTIMSTLIIADIQSDEFGTYSCRSINSVGKTEKTVEVRMKSPPMIVKTSRSEVLYDEEPDNARDALPVVLECEAQGHPEPHYRWTKDGTPLLVQADPRLDLEPGTGNLLISEPRPEDNGQYQCFASNELGTAVSPHVYLINSTRVTFSNSGEDNNYRFTAEIGRPYQLRCPDAYGYPEPKLRWIKALQKENEDGSALSLEFVSDPRVVADPDGSLWFTHVTSADATGEDFKYMCLANNEYRPYDMSIASVIELEVIPPKDGNTNYEDDGLNLESFEMFQSADEVSFRAGEENTLWCIYGGEPTPAIQWKRADGREFESDRFVTRNFGRTLVFKDTQLNDAGGYRCTVHNGVGEPKVHMMRVNVEQTPIFKEPMASQTVREGASVTFTCDAESTADVEYHWMFNGKKITAGHHRRRFTDNKLIIDEVSTIDVGNYACNATSDIGFAFGQAVLNVIPVSHKTSAMHSGSSCSEVHSLRQEVTSLTSLIHSMQLMMNQQLDASRETQLQLLSLIAIKEEDSTAMP